MNLLTRLGNYVDTLRYRNALKPEEIAQFRSYQNDIMTGAGFLPAFTNSSGEAVSAGTAMRISTWFTCLQVRWDSVGMLPFNVYKTTGNSKQIAYDHPAYMLHTRPNPSMTATQFWKVVQQRRDNYGNAYVHIRRGGGKITGYFFLDETDSKVEVYCSKETGMMYYVHKGLEYAGADILHFKGLTTDGKAGRSLTEYHAETIGRLKAIQRFSNRSISKNPGMYATSADKMPMAEPQKKAFKEYWNKEMSGYNTDGDIAVLYNGFDLKTVGINPKDALYLEQIQATKEDIFGITKVPPKLAQNFVTGNTYNNSEQQGLDFLTWGLAINLKDIEEECNYKLFTDSERAAGYFTKFNEKALLRMDSKTQSEVLDKYFKMGVYSINEIRDIQDHNPIEGGDDHYVELNNLGPIRLQDEILAARVQPASKSPEMKGQELLEWFKRQLNGHAVH